MSRRRRRHRAGRAQAEVELNLAAMLDMAFQLLTFFILTFRPSPVEGEIAMNLPPPQPVTNAAMSVAADAPGLGFAVGETLPITLKADETGQLRGVALGDRDIFQGPATAENLKLLDQELRSVIQLQGRPFDQVLVRVDPRLPYDSLMKAVDVCAKQKFADGSPLDKISFTEFTEN